MYVSIKDRGGKDTDQKSQVLVDEYLINNGWEGKTYFQGFSANASKNVTFYEVALLKNLFCSATFT